MAGNVINTGLNLMNTAYNGAGGIVISGDAVKGGYFVTDALENIPSWSSVAGTLCYCTGDSKFYQYDGSSWQEKKFGANTWRKVQLDGTDKLGTGINTNPLNIKAGSNMTITESNGTFTFAATDTDTKNTAGATNSTTANRLFLIGAKNQADSQITYSDSNVYMQSGVLTTSSITTGAIKSSSDSLNLKVASSDGITHGVADFNIDSDGGTKTTLYGHLTIYGDDDSSNIYRPTNQAGAGDLDTYYFNTGIALYNADNDTTYKLSFPAKSGTFATLDDTKIEIVDLTGITGN